MRQAKELMDEHRIRHLPVMDQEGQLVGILSDRDVNLALNPKSLRFKKAAVVGDFMNWPVLTIDRKTSLSDVARCMSEQKVSALIVTSAGQPVGIVTTEDMLNLLERMLREKSGGAGLLDSITFQPIVREALRQAEAAGI